MGGSEIYDIPVANSGLALRTSLYADHEQFPTSHTHNIFVFWC